MKYQPEYRLYQFLTHDWEDREFAESRQGVPCYTLFEVFKNEQGEIYGRSEHPVLIMDTYLDDSGIDDPIALFKLQVARMLEAAEHPILEEPYPYADSGCMTEEEAERFIAGELSFED